MVDTVDRFQSYSGRRGSRSEQVSAMGTTAEILAVKHEEDEAAGVANLKLKAIGRQRFQVVESRRTAHGYVELCACTCTDRQPSE